MTGEIEGMNLLDCIDISDMIVYMKLTGQLLEFENRMGFRLLPIQLLNINESPPTSPVCITPRGHLHVSWE